LAFDLFLKNILSANKKPSLKDKYIDARVIIVPKRALLMVKMGAAAMNGDN